MIITVDCGTTNMRLRLYEGKKVLDEIKKKAGGRNTAFSGSSDYLRGELRSAILELLSRNSKSESEIEIILCSGILASDVGIHYIPHAVAPCGIIESAKQAQRHIFEDITSIPILLIPGVKTLPAEGETDEEKILDRLESMSGEECETYGIMQQLGLHGNFVIALPGSYNKAMEINENGQITSILTGMCGEMIAAMSEHTMLKKTLPSPVIRKIMPDKLIAGFDYAQKHGMSPSLIKARTVRTMRGWNEDEAANFFIGIILVDDILSSARLYSKGKKFVVGGGDPLRKIFCILLERAGVDEIIEIDDDLGRLSPNFGAMEVYSKFLELNA